MDDVGDVVLGDDATDQPLVAGVADHQRHALGDRPGKAGGQIVQHNDPFPRFEQGVDHVASDVPGAAGNEDRHELDSTGPPISTPTRKFRVSGSL